MDNQSIVKWMIQNKVALVGYQAGHIYKGLELWTCGTYDEQIERVNLYRAWRPKTDKKNEIPSWQAFQLAIAGIDPDDVEPRQIDMFDMSEPATEADEYIRRHHKGGKFSYDVTNGGTVKADCGATTQSAQEAIKSNIEKMWSEA